MTTPRRGEVWLVSLDPTLGSEIQKTRPAVVISSDFMGKLPLKLIVPMTDWKDVFVHNLWHVCLRPSSGNGLLKVSAADVFQTRSVDRQRFIRRLGVLSASDLQDITNAVAAIIEYQTGES